MMLGGSTDEEYFEEEYDIAKEEFRDMYPEISKDELGVHIANSLQFPKVLEWLRKDGYKIDENKLWYYFYNNLAIPKRTAPENIKDMFCKSYGLDRNRLVNLWNETGAKD